MRAPGRLMVLEVGRAGKTKGPGLEEVGVEMGECRLLIVTNNNMF